MGQPGQDSEEGKGFQSRDDIMDSILENRNEDLKQEVEDAGGEMLPDEPVEAKPEDDDTKKVEDIPAEPDPEIEDDDIESDGDGGGEADETIELVVDGEKKAMKVSDVIAIAQKNMAADARLAEAERKNREADERLKSKAEDANEEETVVKDDEEAESLIAEKRKAYLYAMNYGEAEEQEEAMIEWERAVRGDTTGQSSVDKEAIKAEIKEELSGDQIRKRFNLPESQGGFGDIMSDTVLRVGCLAQIDEAIRDGADPMDWETYSKVAQSVRQTYLTSEKPRKPTSDDAFEGKKKRKAKVDNLETISDKQGPGKRTPNPQSSEGLRSATIAELAQGRPGQANY